MFFLTVSYSLFVILFYNVNIAGKTFMSHDFQQCTSYLNEFTLFALCPVTKSLNYRYCL